MRAMRLSAGVAIVLAAAAASAAPAEVGGGIYTCIDDKGRRVTSDRPIVECNAREQRILNRDGSLREIKPAPLTAEERADREAAERKAAVARAAQADAVRRDRNLMMRFPDATAHGKAREVALNTVRAAIRATETRLTDLATERKPLDNEAEFYKGKQLPPRLKQQIDANDAAYDAQKSLAQTQGIELVRVNKLYDAELERLKRLWSGEKPGTLSQVADPGAVKPASSSTTR